MKTISDLLAYLAQGHRPVVTFQNKCGDLESYAEIGMRARILSGFVSRDGVAKLKMDFEEFDAHNKPFETFTYYDKDGEPRLNARQAGFYKPQEDLYFMPESDIADYLSIEGEQSCALFEQYKAAQADTTYVQWLEQQLVIAKGLASVDVSSKQTLSS